MQELIDSISTGFKKTPTEVLVFIFLLGGFLFVFLSAFIIIKLVERYKLNKTLSRKYEKYVMVFRLTAREKNIIEEMARFLKNRNKKYLLLLNPKTFSATLHLLQREIKVKAEVLTSLKTKLGFNKARPHSIITDTRDLKLSMPVIIMHDKKIKISGTVSQSTEDSFVIALQEENREIKKNEDVVVFLHNFTGIYAFTVTVRENRGDSLVLNHSRQKERFQRREFYRKQVKLPVLLKKIDSSADPVQAFIVDLSAGGAAIHHPRMHIAKGDDLKIYFQKANDDIFYLNAEVVRAARNGTEISVRYGHLSEQYRDRIIGMINVQQ
ncbi:MAG: PilZ domain-containing protein [Spirochaetales bacterium]|nr:PilZ domain-containing protein [Spirochaetales bacterium]